MRDAKDATGFSRDLAQFGEMGFTGILIDEADGGLGLGHVEAGIVLEEIGRNLSPSPFLSTAVGAVTAMAAASSEQRARWLPGIPPGRPSPRSRSTRAPSIAPNASRSPPSARATASG